MKKLFEIAKDFSIKLAQKVSPAVRAMQRKVLELADLIEENSPEDNPATQQILSQLRSSQADGQWGDLTNDALGAVNAVRANYLQHAEGQDWGQVENVIIASGPASATDEAANENTKTVQQFISAIKAMLGQGSAYTPDKEEEPKEGDNVGAAKKKADALITKYNAASTFEEYVAIAREYQALLKDLPNSSGVYMMIGFSLAEAATNATDTTTKKKYAKASKAWLKFTPYKENFNKGYMQGIKETISEMDKILAS